MNQDVISFVERYQLIYEKDPNSKVFAPLAEAYRRMGLLDEAIDLAEKGVEKHPHFSSGRVALGKCYVQKGEYAKAVVQLKAAVDLSPENILAHQLMAESYTKLNKPVEALQAYKMILFLNPHDVKATNSVKKLESRIFGEAAPENPWTDEDFSMEKLKQIDKSAPKSEEPEEAPALFAELERELALLDSRFDRGDWPAARKQIDELLKTYPDHPDVLTRKNYIDELTSSQFVYADPPEALEPLPMPDKKDKIQKLKDVLAKVESRRKS